MTYIDEVKNARLSLPLLLSLLIIQDFAHAELCKKWAAPELLGKLERKPINEASGLAVSKQFADRLYWINDSGDKGNLYHTNLKGENARKIGVQNFKGVDTEALALGDCGGFACLIVADIGDNKSQRQSITLVTIKEEETFPAKVKPLRKITLRYPDGAHDAEALVVLPDGRLLIITKVMNLFALSAGEAGVYVLSREDFLAPADDKTLRKIGSLPLAKFLPNEIMLSQIATDAAVDEARGVLGILTYQKAVEIPLDRLEQLEKVAQWQAGTDYAAVPLKALAQQETMNYAGGKLIWSTEYHSPETPLYGIKCEN